MPRPASRTAPLTLALSILGFAGLALAPLPAQGSLPLVSWEVPPPPTIAYLHAAIIDTVRGQMLSDGGIPPEASGDAWTFDLVTLRWRLVSWAEYGPTMGRYGHSAIYDAPRDRMVVYGGRAPQFGSIVGGGYSRSLTNGAKSDLPLPTAPGARYNHVALMDVARDEMILLGGEGLGGTSPADTVYRMSLSTNTWTRTATLGAAPLLAGGQIAMLDAAHDRIVALDGSVRQLTLSDPPTWSTLTPAGTPPPNHSGRVIGDPAHDRLLLVRDDASVWTLTLGGSPTWSQAAAAGAGPPARKGFTLLLEAGRNRAVLFGGWDSGPLNKIYNDTWAFDLASLTWTLLSNPGVTPSQRNHAATIAPGMDAMLVFGGVDGPGNEVLAYPLDLAHPFSTLATAGPRPAPRSQHDVAHDPVRNRLLVFGGVARTGGALLADVHALTLDGTPTWSPIIAPGGPDGRRFPNVAYDTVRDRLLVFGGGFGSAPSGVSRTDVWALSLSGTPVWQLIVADGVLPPLITGTLAFYDPARDQLVVLGMPASSQMGMASWKLNLSGPPVWTPWTSPSWFAAEPRGALDLYGDRILLYGGLGQTAQPGEEAAVLRSLSLASPTWTVHDLPNKPLFMATHSMVHDPTRFRTILFGGMETPNGLNATRTRFIWTIQQDAATPALVSLVSAEIAAGEARVVWQVSDAASTSWRVERSRLAGVWELAGMPEPLGQDRLEYREGGLKPGERIGYRLVALENGTERSLGEAWLEVPAAGLALSRIEFAQRGVLRYAVTLPDERPARLEAFDLGGRRLGGIEVRGDGSAPVAGELRLTGGGGSPGICFVRLSHAGRVVTRRIALVY